MDIEFCVKNYIENYNLFIEQLSFLFKDDDHKQLLEVLKNESKDKKWLKGVKLQQCLTNELFDLFIESKIKLLSHKDENTKNVSESLFGEELSLKKIFNNRDEHTKFVLWAYLHLMMLMVELAIEKKTNKKDRSKKLTTLIEKNSEQFEKEKVKVQKSNNPMKDPKTMIKEMFKVDVNNDTNEMLTDIIKSFETSLSGNGNPLAGILDISQKISTKYQDKINTGDIELNKLMEGIQKNIPGIDEMMKSGIMGAGGLGEMLGGGASKAPKETVIIDENFSTANVDLGKQAESKGFNIGKMLNIANSLGVLPGGGASGGGASGGGASGGGMPGMDPKLMGLFDMMKNIGNVNSKEAMEEMKTKMDSFLSEQGIDVNKLNGELDNIMQKSSNTQEEEKQETQQ